MTKAVEALHNRGIVHRYVLQHTPDLGAIPHLTGQCYVSCAETGISRHDSGSSLGFPNLQPDCLPDRMKFDMQDTR